MQSRCEREAAVAGATQEAIVGGSSGRFCLEAFGVSTVPRALSDGRMEPDDFIRRFTAGVKIIEVDDLGRILIAKDLAVFASISKDVVLSSAVNIVEIWDKDMYEKAIDDSVIDFADLAEDVMGNVNDDDNGIS